MLRKSDSKPIDWHITETKDPGDQALHSIFPSSILVIKLYIQYFRRSLRSTWQSRREPRSGRPHVTAHDVDQSIVSMAEEICFVTPKETRSELQVPISARTVRRRLDQTGLFGRVARISYPFT